MYKRYNDNGKNNEKTKAIKSFTDNENWSAYIIPKHDNSLSNSYYFYNKITIGTSILQNTMCIYQTCRYESQSPQSNSICIFHTETH